ncbi:uncharacterized protein METZ01_LOCUS478150 [marine metagenome]|uniref:Uncharacterized protein n=1 Tax=marine metagenome TaxID=408172 RepID=A0A383BYJ4_9ZZZZ
MKILLAKFKNHMPGWYWWLSIIYGQNKL